MQNSGSSIERVLPSEVLLRIFDHACSYIAHSTLYNLALVCRVFNSLAMQMLYRELTINFTHDRGLWVRRRPKLLRTLEERPQLYRLIKKMNYLVARLNDRHEIELDVLRRATPFILHFNLGANRSLPQDFASHICNMDLKGLGLEGIDSLPLLWPMIGGDTFVHLESLNINVNFPTKALPERLDLPRLPQRCGLSNLHSLTIQGSNFSYKLLMSLIMCAKKLTFFELDMVKAFRVYGEASKVNYLSTVQRILNVQKSSLEVISLSEWLCADNRSYAFSNNDILSDDEYDDDDDSHAVAGHTNEAEPRMLDLSTFPRLRELHLNYENLFNTSIEEASQALSAPNLKYIQINMRKFYERSASCTHFRERHADFLVEFVQRRQQILATGPGLRELHIAYDMSDDEELYWGLDDSWPYDHFEPAALRLQELGVRLTWPPPYTTKEVWKFRQRGLVESYNNF